MTAKDKARVYEEIAKETLSLLGVEASVSVEQDPENEAIVLQLETDNPGLLIGRHGETIDSLQSLVGQIGRQRTGEWQRVLVNVGDWRERREEWLKNLAVEVAERAIGTGEEQHLYDLSAAERRIIHLELSRNKDVVTESEGEDRDRHLVVKPKK